MTLPTPAPASTALVTGASSGIGADLARGLAARGHGVTLVARREDRLRQLAEELGAAHHIRADVVATDLTDAGARSELVATLAARGLTVEILVNNAGFSTTGPVARADRQRELALVRTDVEAVVDLCTLLLPGMVDRRRGAVLNVASTAAFQPLPGQAAYAAAKSFVLSYSHAIRAEVRRAGVTVTALCPGPVHTGFVEAAGFSDEEAEAALPRFMWLGAPQVAEAALAGLEHGRPVVIPGAPNRIAAGLAYLSPRPLITQILARQHPALRR